MFTNKAENQIGRNGCDLIEPGFFKLAFDVVLLGERETAVGLHTDIPARQEASEASIFAILASAPQGSPASNIRAAFSTMSQAASTSA